MVILTASQNAISDFAQLYCYFCRFDSGIVMRFGKQCRRKRTKRTVVVVACINVSRPKTRKLEFDRINHRASKIEIEIRLISTAFFSSFFSFVLLLMHSENAVSLLASLQHCRLQIIMYEMNIMHSWLHTACEKQHIIQIL